MLKPWHKEDIWAALAARGWSVPVPVQAGYYTVGEAYRINRSQTEATLLFVADAGQGFTGPKSIEEVVLEGQAASRLWLHRTRDRKWQAELYKWADQLSGLTPPPA